MPLLVNTNDLNKKQINNVNIHCGGTELGDWWRNACYEGGQSIRFSNVFRYFDSQNIKKSESYLKPYYQN